MVADRTYPIATRLNMVLAIHCPTIPARLRISARLSLATRCLRAIAVIDERFRLRGASVDAVLAFGRYLTIELRMRA